MKAEAWAKFRTPLLNAFVWSNLAFLGVDVWLAHSVNDFHNPWEWVPLAVSPLVCGFLAVAWLLGNQRRAGWSRALILASGSLSVATGLSGLYLHLHSHFLAEMTLKNLVYTAPFLAPLAYSGLGFLLLMNLLEDAEREDWGRWVLFFALGGFAGNFGLSLADHAQNGFFNALEWIPVAAAALAVGFLAVAVFGRPPARFYPWCAAVVGIQILVGTAGFALHLLASLERFAGRFPQEFIFGPPLFAPFLFCDLAVLAAIGLTDLYLKEAVKGSRKNKFTELAPRFGSDLAGPDRAEPQHT